MTPAVKTLGEIFWLFYERRAARRGRQNRENQFRKITNY